MGNICGKEDPEPALPTRALHTAPPSHRTAAVPAASRRKVGGPARTLGSNSKSNSPAPGSPAEAAADARRKAAEAAEARAIAASKPGGKLQSQLAAQKRQSRNETLKMAGEEERRVREIAQNEDVRVYS
ncbi:hypothetical protein E4U17_004164 [Claviceps sp. LM77 group G4]|nr:hypothetical protein E4U17_004164 [Claviceps sp. LM77 group G4]KAG6061220.1 hypothetical protein E4U33_006736 [Claviceps sp. LM78 group G4]KAG6085040.1 hypothetical protein E4U16_000093 [Claviceps sp. LM84 group G4]